MVVFGLDVKIIIVPSSHHIVELQHSVVWYKLLSYLSLFLSVCVCIFLSPESDHAVGQKEEKEKNIEGLD